MIAAAAAALLTTVADARQHTAERLARLLAVERALLAIDRDLSAVADAPLRGEAAAVAFDRWQGQGVTALAYTLAGGMLERRDGGRRQRLLAGVAAVRWRYFGDGWQDRWPLDAAQAATWPAAVAVDLTLAGAPGGRVRRVVDLPVRPLPPDAPP